MISYKYGSKTLISYYRKKYKKSGTYLNGKGPDVGERNIPALLMQPVQQRAQRRQFN